MQLRNHIAHRFLTDKTFTDEILETTYPKEYEYLKHYQDDSDLPADVHSAVVQKMGNLYRVASMEDQAAYYITNSVINNLKHIKVTETKGVHDWSVFKVIDNFKLTFIFRNNTMVRAVRHGQVIQFLFIKYSFHAKEDRAKYKFPGTALFVHLFVDVVENEIGDHFYHKDAEGLQKQFYKLLLFFFFAENETKIVNGGRSYGTKKQADALDNSSDLPITIVNCNWNITSVRLTGFDVCGHMRMQACGPARADHRLTFVQPYKKNGYVRKATKEA